MSQSSTGSIISASIVGGPTIEQVILSVENGKTARSACRTIRRETMKGGNVCVYDQTFQADVTRMREYIVSVKGPHLIKRLRELNRVKIGQVTMLQFCERHGIDMAATLGIAMTVTS